jgi:hypothetical protein
MVLTAHFFERRSHESSLIAGGSDVREYLQDDGHGGTLAALPLRRRTPPVLASFKHDGLSTAPNLSGLPPPSGSGQGTEAQVQVPVAPDNGRGRPSALARPV